MSIPSPARLEELIALKRRQNAQRQVTMPLQSLRALAGMQARPVDIATILREDRVVLLASIQDSGDDEQVEDNPITYDPVPAVRQLVAQGVEALVVPKDEDLNRGGIEDLTLLCSAVKLPVIRQDIILEEYQVAEIRAAGADGLMLFSAVVADHTLRGLISVSQRFRMTAVAQVHDEDGMRSALSFEPRVVAIDNHNLYTGAVDLAKTARLLELVPAHIATISMGGLYTAEDVAQVANTGVDAVLIDQAVLMTAEATAIREVLNAASADPVS